MITLIESFAQKWFHNYSKHEIRGKVLLILGILCCTLPVMGGSLLIIGALDYSKWPQILAATLFIIVNMILGIAAIKKANSMVRTIPLGWGAEVKTPAGEYLVSHAEGNIWMLDVTGMAAQHHMGDTVRMHDMRARVLAVSHYTIASDGTGVSTQVSVLWRIWELNRYLNLTITPAAILEDTVRRNLTHFIHQNSSADLCRNTGMIEDFVMRKIKLSLYGICVDSVQVVAIDALALNVPLNE